MSALLTAFLWKAGVTALVIISVARLAERLGPFLAGIFMGLPISVAPAMALLAMDQSDGFVSEAALYSFGNTASNLAFLLAYVCAARWSGLWISLAVAYAVWAVAALSLSKLPLTLPIAFGIVVTALVLTRIFMPRHDRPLAVKSRASWRFLLLRGVLGGTVIGVIVTAANVLGENLSGVMVSIPVLFATAAWMLNSMRDNRLAAATLSITDIGMVSYASFCLTAHLLSGPLPSLAAIAIGIAVSIVVSGCVALGRRFV